MTRTARIRLPLVSMVEAFAAAARRDRAGALRGARAVLAHADALGISFGYVRWSWPLAARAASELQDHAAARELLTLLDSYQPGHIAPMLRAERDLARARLAGRDGDQAAAALAVGEARALGERLRCQPGLTAPAPSRAPGPRCVLNGPVAPPFFSQVNDLLFGGYRDRHR